MRFLKFALAAFVALYLMAFAAIWHFQRHLMYFPHTEQVAPDLAGFPGAQSLILSTADNQHLIAWFRAPAAGQPLILYFHGNANNLAQDASRLKALAGDDYGLFAVDYRGFGGSTGSPDQTGILLDAEAAYAKTIELGINPQNIVVYGHSLGTGVAVNMAASHKVRAIVLEAPYSSTVDVAAERYWMFPARMMMLDQFHSDEWIKNVHIPLLVLHGEDDWTIPFRYGQRLFALANEPKTFMPFPGAGHMLLLGEGVAATARRWIDKQVKN